METKFEIQNFFPVKPSELYEGWLDSGVHSNMTGGSANMSKIIGEPFTAWDGYIRGKNIKLIQDQEIIQTWRTSDFKEEDEDSELIIKLIASEGGTTLSLFHSKIPKGQPDYAQGWEEHYFTPMKEYF